MEHEDLELPPKLKKILKQAINSQSVAEVDSHIEEVVRLINLYRSLFGGGYSTLCTNENENLLKTSLSNFSADFKTQVAATKASNQDAQIQMLNAQKTTPGQGSKQAKMNDAI